MKIYLNVEDIESTNEDFLVKKIKAYIDLVVEHPEFFLDKTIKKQEHYREVIIKDDEE